MEKCVFKVVIVTKMILLKGMLSTVMDCCSSVLPHAKKQAATRSPDQHSLRLTNLTYAHVKAFVKYQVQHRTVSPIASDLHFVFDV